jgi:signal transduction histidine kinase
LAHELNNPLSIVLQGSQNILRRLSDDLPRNRAIAEKIGIKLEQIRGYLEKNQILKFLNNMNEASQRAARIVADMMTFADCRHMDFSSEKLEDILDTALRSGHYDAALTGDWDLSQILIVRDYDPTLRPVHCNRKAIERVFLNLIKNAAQALADDAKPLPRITLRTYQEDDWFCVEIEDNGPGLDEKTRRHLFEPFFTTKPPGVGIGLGLSVAYFIVTEQHDGQISVSSTPGQGTCFTVYLPLSGKSRSGAA